MKASRAVVGAVALCLSSLAEAQVTYTAITSADAFLATGSPENPNGTDLTDLNFGEAGTLVIAPAAAAKGEFQSVIQFDLSEAPDLFNSTYGTNWTISEISLELASNYGRGGVQPNNPIFNVIHGGDFVIEWLSDDTWVEGTGTPNLPSTDGVIYHSLPSLLASAREILCTNTYSPPGDNVHVTWVLPMNTNLIADVLSGGEISLRFYAADDLVSYLFNSHSYGRGNEPLIHVTAIPVLKILSGAFTNGLFHLTAIGSSNLQYQVQANASLAATNWKILGTVSADSAGFLQFDDTNLPNQTQLFYRLMK
jgi:hypothetical protein